MNIVIFGACEFIWSRSFVVYMKKFGVKVTTFSYPFASCSSHIYNLEKKENTKIIKESDLIIFSPGRDIHSKAINEYLWFYQKLHSLKKKILVILWHHRYKNNAFHRQYCFYYGFNFIDLYQYCTEKKILNFYTSYSDFRHPLSFIMEQIADSIINNFNNFLPPFSEVEYNEYPIFQILDPENIFCNLELKHVKIRNHLYYQNIYKIDLNNKLVFSKKYENYTLVGIHNWSERVILLQEKDRPKICIKNKEQTIVKKLLPWENFSSLFLNEFIIDSNTTFSIDKSSKISSIGIISFLLVKNTKQKWSQNLSCTNNLQYNFNNIIPPLEFYKNIIEEYNERKK
ncbi:hypothetical protein [Campylobacter lari]|uniref:hypothetical protein n=1 Tax=Campylobacter lari TaxID=201 RepID=UPI00214A2184|nr:hypothetical protein [Campylobacter lari]EAJ5674026.1 hypothetical protein [Campylobacter lari]MCR2059188.1 hypothetical protein [Campylobacter lari subsp. concheus]